MIRLFNPEKDLADLRNLIYSEKVQENMDEVEDISDDELIDWMREDGSEGSILYAISDDSDKMCGFIYFYPHKSGRLEISYAKVPETPRKLIIESINEAMVQAKQILAKGGDLRILADIEDDNMPSINLVVDLGYTKNANGMYEKLI